LVPGKESSNHDAELIARGLWFATFEEASGRVHPIAGKMEIIDGQRQGREPIQDFIDD
jgi:hypothetical protein